MSNPSESNTGSWNQVERLFNAALELPPEERRAYLDRECPDPEVRKEVASLLDHCGEGVPLVDDAIASAAASVASEPDPDERLVGTRLGPYRVESIVGHGGMGAVYLAWRDDAEFRQRVAIKLVRAAAESPSTLRRFRQERQILARLSHPNIARLLDGGSTPEGVPYLVMEFIEGEPITAWCERQGLGIRDRLRLFLRACEGVDFAHRELVVHRDLKPANILVTADGTPKLLDFGIAKLLEPGAAEESATLTGLQVMTPEYASPEQMRGEPPAIAADVYSLGLILYELLTRKKAQPMSSRAPDSMARVICEVEPTPPASLEPQLAGDLDNIVRKAIRKDAQQRYASAGDLARDIERHLEGRPVMARSPTYAYRLAKFLRRNRVAATAGVLLAAGLAGGLALESWLRPQVPRVTQVVQLTQSGRVEIGDGIATDGSQVYFTEGSFGQWSLSQISVKGGTSQPMTLTPSLLQPSIFGISPDSKQLLVAGDFGEGQERPLWVAPVAGGTARRVGDLLCRAATWLPDGKHILIAHGSSIAQINPDGTGAHKLFDAPRPIAYASLSLAPVGGPDTVIFGMYDRPSAVGELWETAADGRGLHPLLRNWGKGARWPEGDYAGRWMPSAKYYLFRRRRGKVSAVWGSPQSSWLPLFNLPPFQIYSSPMDFYPMAPSPDGKQIFVVAGQERRELLRYDGKRGQFVPYLNGTPARAVDFSHDGQWLTYTVVPDDTLWRSRVDGSERVQLTSAPLRTFQPRWSPDGTRIAFGGSIAGQTSKVYLIPFSSTGGGAPEALAPGPFSESSPNWSPDGNSLILRRDPLPGTTGRAGLYILALKTGKREFLPGSEPFPLAVWSPDARQLAATNTSNSQVMLFDFRTGRWTQLAAGTAPSAPFWSRDGKYVYFEETIGGKGQPILRVRISDGKTEEVASARQLLQSNVTSYDLCGLTPENMPMATVMRRNSDLYSLELEQP